MCGCDSSGNGAGLLKTGLRATRTQGQLPQPFSGVAGSSCDLVLRDASREMGEDRCMQGLAGLIRFALLLSELRSEALKLVHGQTVAHWPLTWPILLAYTIGMPSIDYIYAIQFGDYVKIGTTGDPAARMRQLPGGCVVPDDLDPDCVKRPLMAVAGNYDTERLLHSIFEQYRVKGEWFHLPADLVDALIRQNSDEKRASLFKMGASWIPMTQSYDYNGADMMPKPVDF